MYEGRFNLAPRVRRHPGHLQGQLAHSPAREEQLPLEQLPRGLHCRHVPVLPGAGVVQPPAVEERHHRRHDPSVGVDRPLQVRRAGEQDHEGHAPAGQHQGLRLPARDHLPPVCRQVRKLDGARRDVPVLLQQGQSLDRPGVLRLHGVDRLGRGGHLDPERALRHSPGGLAVLVLPLLPGQVQEVRGADQHR